MKFVLISIIIIVIACFTNQKKIKGKDEDFDANIEEVFSNTNKEKICKKFNALNSKKEEQTAIQKDNYAIFKQYFAFYLNNVCNVSNNNEKNGVFGKLKKPSLTNI